MRKRAAYRKKKYNKFSLFLVSGVVVIIMVVVAVKAFDLNDRLSEKRQEAESYQALIEAEEERAKELEEFEKYTQTKQYKEEIAKDKLGLVYDGEIIFKQEN